MPFGLTEAKFAALAFKFGTGGLMTFMMFIVWNLAHTSKAGRMGTFVLFLALGLGLTGFVAKQIIELVILR